MKSLCNICYKSIDSKYVEIDEKLYISKECDIHGIQNELYEDNISYHNSKLNFDKPGTESLINHKFNGDCPNSCGICENHKQHTCIGLIEVTSRCNLDCQMCYAKEAEFEDLSLETISNMMDFYQTCENNQAEILQISGGEPTLHPEIISILKLAKEKNFKYIMLNTNGLKFLEDDSILKVLSSFEGGFEVYLQFDGFDKKVNQIHRGKDILDTKLKIIDKLIEFKIPMTLVVSISDMNISQVGEIFTYSINKPYIRGINYQPIAFYGPEKGNRITLTRVINELVDQSNTILSYEDFIPLPCNVHRISVAYFLKGSKGFSPILRSYETNEYLPYIENTLNFNLDDLYKKNPGSLAPCDCLKNISVLKKNLPKNFIIKSKKEKINYVNHNTFRITITSFLDRFNFDSISMEKECVHIITPNLKRVPFSAYNIKRGKKYANQ